MASSGCKHRPEQGRTAALCCTACRGVDADTYGNWMDEFFVQRSVWGDRVWGAPTNEGVPRVSSVSLSSAPCPGLATEHFTVLALVRFYSVEFGLRLRPLCGLHDDSAHEGSFYRMDFVYGAPEPVAIFYRLDIVYGALQPMTSTTASQSQLAVEEGFTEYKSQYVDGCRPWCPCDHCHLSHDLLRLRPLSGPQDAAQRQHHRQLLLAGSPVSFPASTRKRRPASWSSYDQLARCGVAPHCGLRTRRALL